MFRFNDGRDWFFEKRFGLFIHFGLYAIDGWHEQDQWRRSIPRKEYEKLAEKFNPEKFDPNLIIDLAQAVGMGYLCITAKHHDGFCLWDTAETDYNIMNTPYGRDLIKELADACHARDFAFGLYYSVADWHHPNYPNRGRHHELAGPEEGDEPDWDLYVDFLKRQVRELCTNYGEVNHFFWDMNVPGHQDPSINEMISELQPNAIINDRGFDDGDFGTPERDFHAADISNALRFDRPTEACNSIGAQSWGYRQNEDYHSVRYLIESIDGMMARGGNYLLNVGPMGDGTVPRPAVELFRAIGSWYFRVKESFEGAEPASELTENRSVLLTKKNTSLYVHLTGIPKSKAVILNPIDITPKKATILNTDEEVRTEVELLPAFWKSGKKYLRICSLPVDEQNDEVIVVRLDFDALPEAANTESDATYRG